MKIAVLFAVLALACAKKQYDGYKVLTLQPVNERHLEAIRALHEDIELDFWSETDVMVPANKMEFVQAALDKVGLQHDIKIADVQADMEAHEAEIKMRSEDKFYDLYNWNTYDQILDAVDDFVASCPSGYSCTRESMGSSYQGRDIPALVIRSGNKPLVYLDSLIHCREWLAGSTTLLLADRLINGNDAEAERLRSTYNWYIAPVINPDGYVYTWSNERLWRKNRQPNSGSVCVGTDLNRNFDANWRFSGTSTSPCSDTYGGSAPASGVETAIVQNTLQSLSGELYGVVSYHAYARMWLHAYGYTTVAGGSTCATPGQYGTINAVALAARNAVQSTGGQSWTYGPVCTVIYPASGSTVDYAYDKVGAIYAYTPEVRGTSFAPPASEISPNYLEMWAGLVAMVDEIANQ